MSERVRCRNDFCFDGLSSDDRAIQSTFMTFEVRTSPARTIENVVVTLYEEENRKRPERVVSLLSCSGHLHIWIEASESAHNISK
jgi:hypothetical protein